MEHAISVETFEKARVYGLDKESFSVIKTAVFGLIVANLELYFGVLSRLWFAAEDMTKTVGWNVNNEVIVSCFFVAIFTIFTVIKDMPFSIYRTFVLEEKHNFNKQTAGFFIKDQIKSLILGLVLSIPISAAIVYIVQWGGSYFIMYLYGFVSTIMLLLVTIYPVFIAPLFDKYRPLDEGPLRTSIENLASTLKFPLAQLYVVEGSTRSSHSNAYFYGLFGSKRIVLYDTLLKNKGKPITEDSKSEDIEKGCDDKEVLAVLGHELGHWKLGHVTKNIIIAQVQLLLVFSLFGILMNYDVFYMAVGFPEGQKPILVGMAVILTYILTPYNAVVNFCMIQLSRRFEYEADAFAKSLGFKEDLSKALIKLNIDNLGFPVYDEMYSMFNHSHPTLLQRIDRLKEEDPKTK